MTRLFNQGFADGPAACAADLADALEAAAIGPASALVENAPVGRVAAAAIKVGFRGVLGGLVVDLAGHMPFRQGLALVSGAGAADSDAGAFRNSANAAGGGGAGAHTTAYTRWDLKVAYTQPIERQAVEEP